MRRKATWEDLKVGLELFPAAFPDHGCVVAGLRRDSVVLYGADWGLQYYQINRDHWGECEWYLDAAPQIP